MKISFRIKQILKMCMQKIVMPLMYRRYTHERDVEKGLVLFCDSHNYDLPFSMKRMSKEINRLQWEGDPYLRTEDWVMDFSKMDNKTKLRWINDFMKKYAVADWVFMCDNFLPVASCKKRPETKVIQLWHSGGLLKKFGYDTTDDIPAMYKGNVYKNYDLLTVSAPCCVPVLSSAMRLPEGIAQATGISRTDYYFDDRWNEVCRINFYSKYPKAEGKKIILWAPTFRGNAAEPYLRGMEGIKKAMEATGDKYFWILKLHPHMERCGMKSNCDIPCEELFCVTDLMITDYSSVVFDYLAYGRPFVLYAPDYEEFEKSRGFYVDYDSYPTTVVKDDDKLVPAIEYELANRKESELRQCFEYHMGACDGASTERILEAIRNL